MSIRSVDMMILISKMGDVEKAQQSLQQQPRVAQEQATAQEIKRKDVELSQVQKPPQGEHSGKISERPDRNRRRGGQSGGGREEEREQEPGRTKSGDKPGGGSRTGGIDITI